MASALLTFCILLLLAVITESKNLAARPRDMNAIDQCWRGNQNWASNRQQLASCSVGFAGKTWGNTGKDVTWYEVTNPDDDPINPKPGTLRYGASFLKNHKVWITFARDMIIKLQKPLFVKSFTTIDGRGARVQIAYGSGFLLYQVSNVIIHGLEFHDLQPQGAGRVMVSGGKTMDTSISDGDAIRLVSSNKVWIDHNTLYSCHDGLLDVSRGSTWITISNNWFRDHNKVMLLGHDDSNVEDKKMKVTVVYNRFGPRANQRMPRVRHGYAHVVNNFYDGWGIYAIGGSMSPSIRSEANLFVAPKYGNREVTWREGGNSNSWNWDSVGDAFLNGAYFVKSGVPNNGPHYDVQQRFPISKVNAVRALTRQAGALTCFKRSKC